ncbi:MAG TPA: Flp pilus assembly protein CpaB [Devosiaceae bacterium]|nr:Flp pilus assembly protein CpaB [Devosiaceae bacterium]
MRPARMLLLLVALVAGGLAAFLATRGSAPPAPVVQQIMAPEQKPATQVLVAKQAIGVGQRLAAGDVEWQPWPESAVRPEYITVAKTPDAPAKITGTVARFEIFPGEPILDAKLVHTDQGYMSAVLDPGMRGVSIDISAASGSGGFIIPNDRVDVVVTDSSTGQPSSRVLLNNVKVLAIGTRLGQTGTTGAPPDPSDPKSQIFTSEAIATLELTPTQADTLINATASGKVSLVLRSVADFAQAAGGNGVTDVRNTDDSVRVIRFGRASNVQPGSAQVNPAAYVPPPVLPTVAPPVAIPTPPAPITNTVTGPGGAVTTTVTTTTPAAATPVTPPVSAQ